MRLKPTKNRPISKERRKPPLRKSGRLAKKSCSARPQVEIRENRSFPARPFRPPPSSRREDRARARSDWRQQDSRQFVEFGLSFDDLAHQAIEIVGIEKKVMVGRVMRSAYWLNHDPSGLVEAEKA
jgi:hypothetical protein